MRTVRSGLSRGMVASGPKWRRERKERVCVSSSVRTARPEASCTVSPAAAEAYVVSEARDGDWRLTVRFSLTANAPRCWRGYLCGRRQRSLKPGQRACQGPA
jgi:hypothetical protein